MYLIGCCVVVMTATLIINKQIMFISV